jgi:hypothetical protein
LTGTGAATVAAPGAMHGAPKRGWNGGSKPSRPGAGRAKAAISRERTKLGTERGVRERGEAHRGAKSAQRLLRKSGSAALRRSKFGSRASSMSSTCSRRQLETAAGSRCWRPGACGAGAWYDRATRDPATLKWAPTGAPALSIKRYMRRGACRQRLFRSPPEAGRGESMPSLAGPDDSTVSAPSYGRCPALASWRWRAGRPRLTRSAAEAPSERHATATLCRIVDLVKARLTRAPYWSK